jgi:hypothetical protein
MSHRALYYPTWDIQSPRFLFEALLYWERVGCIVPFPGFRPGGRWPQHVAKEMAELHERYVDGHYPSEAVVNRVHDRLAWLAEHEPPSSFWPERLDQSEMAAVSAHKLAGRTIEMLERAGWIRLDERAGNDQQMYVMRDLLAAFVMGTVADEMSSKTFPPLTGDPSSFAAACNRFLVEVGAADRVGFVTSGSATRDFEDTDYAFGVAKFVRLGVDKQVTATTLRRLVAIREDPDFDGLREAFCSHVDTFLSELRSAAGAERESVERDWSEKFTRDRRGLKAELRRANIEALTDKEGLIAIAVGAAPPAGGALAARPVAGLVVGLGIAVTALARQTKQRRHDALTQHWSSWLFTLSRPKRLLLV